MNFHRIACKKCRANVINPQNLLTLQEWSRKDEGVSHRSDCQSNVWFVVYEGAPEAITSIIEQSGYTRGKLLCEQCGSKVGGFDFVSGSKCECSSVHLPPVWISRKRVDLKMALPSHIENRLQEYRQAEASTSTPRVFKFDEPVAAASEQQMSYGHEDHMFDTGCKTCRQEFLASEKNFEFRGPVSHGNHVFDTTCDICRAVFLSGHIESDYEFQVESEIAIDSLSVTEEVEEESVAAAPSLDLADEPVAAVTSQDTAGESGGEGNAASTSIAPGEEEEGIDEADEMEEMEADNPFNDLALPDPEEEELKQDADAVVADEGDEAKEEEEAPNSMTCAVCLELLYMPHWCNPCQHVFCSPCLRRLRGISPGTNNTRCPLCRNVIIKCIPHHEMSRHIKSLYPEEHRRRRLIEKRTRRHPQPPLPGAPIPGSLTSFLQVRAAARNRAGGGSQVLAAGAGVCFVVLLMMLGFTVFATTFGFLLWYLVEVSMDLLCDLFLEVGTFFDLAYQSLVLLCIEGKVPRDLMYLMSASAGRMLNAYTKIVNRTENAEEDREDVQEAVSVEDGEAGMNGTSSGVQFLSRMAQAQMANYVLVGFLVTYLLYRFAKHVQQVRRVEA